MAAEMDEVRQQLASVPASVVVANHAMGLYELAAIHLSSQPPNFAEAQVAIDAMAAIVEGLRGAWARTSRRWSTRSASCAWPTCSCTAPLPRHRSNRTRLHRCRGGPAGSKSTAVSTAIVRVPSAIAVQWKANVVPSSAVIVPSPASSSKLETIPTLWPNVNGRSWRAGAR